MFDNLTFKTENRLLTNAESKKVISFIFNILIQQSLSKVRIIYRGDNLSNIREKYHLSGYNWTMFNDFLFIIGEKGKAYRKEYRNKISIKWKLFNIDNTTPLFFEYIFRKYNKVLKLAAKQIISDFNNSNPIFAEYFKNNNNKIGFITAINSLDNKDKLKLRDYFLMPLHHLGAKGIFNNSFFLSTTRDINTAISFATNNSNPEGLIIVSWIPNPINNVGLTFNYLNNAVKLVNNLKLPTYLKSFYPKQNEISLKGGLLPHYILGYIMIKDNEFELNPNLFTTKLSCERIIQNGLEIDQTSFVDKLKKSDYECFFTVDDRGTYREHL